MSQEYRELMQSASNRALRAVALGVTAALAVLGVAELSSLFVSPESSPLFSVGALAIDLAPGWLKETMIALFGTGDKLALLIMLGVVVAILAALTGIAEVRRRGVGMGILGIVAAVAIFAVVTRPEATPLWAIPTLVGTLVGVWVLYRGRRLLSASGASRSFDALHVSSEVGGIRDEEAQLSEADRAAQPHEAMARRSFLRFVGVTSAVAVVAGLGARVMNGGTAAVSALRAAIKLPQPAVAAPAVPTGAELEVPGITPLITPNKDFYRIDIALQVPQIDPSTWELKIFGLVDTPVTITYDELLELPLEEHITTIACVSNTVGGDLIGNATWLGYPMRELLDQVGIDPTADMVLSSGPDGFSAGTPLDVLTDPARNALLAVGMNGEPLPPEHGFPARLIVPGLFGYVSATKWVTSIEVTRFADAEGYWTPRGWSAEGPVKTQSRIDTPRPNERIAVDSTSTSTSGSLAIAGVAWAPHTGVARVEVQIDGGAWRQATLASAISDDTWVQWSLPWPAESGQHTARVRATDKSGYTQTSDEAPPAPDGATGRDSISFSV